MMHMNMGNIHDDVLSMCSGADRVVDGVVMPLALCAVYLEVVTSVCLQKSQVGPQPDDLPICTNEPSWYLFLHVLCCAVLLVLTFPMTRLLLLTLFPLLLFEESPSSSFRNSDEFHGSSKPWALYSSFLLHSVILSCCLSS